MPSLAALEAYNQYLTQYCKTSSSNKQDLHDSKKLKDVYGSIQKKNSSTPLFLNEPSKEEVLSALILKDDVYSYHQDIAKLYANNPADPFMQRFPYCNNEEMATVSLSNDPSDAALPQTISLEVKNFATPQTNIGSFLKSSLPVSLPSGNYSFDLRSRKYSYELQFDVYGSDTNYDLQNRIARLLNKSNLGVNAAVLQDSENSSLCVISDSIGKPLKEELHFNISDDNTSQTAGIVDYLGLNEKIAPPQNAIINYEGQDIESYNNTFNIYGRYELTLNKSAANIAKLPEQLEIGFYPDIESLAKNIEGFVNGYNELRASLSDTVSAPVLKKLNNLMQDNISTLSDFGITMLDDKSLSFEEPENWTQNNPNIADTSNLTLLGNKILNNLQDIAVDPMVHINRKVGIYQNPLKKEMPLHPYVNYYSGLLFHKKV